jgi:two-component system LytT family sensor kinase
MNISDKKTLLLFAILVCFSLILCTFTFAFIAHADSTASIVPTLKGLLVSLPVMFIIIIADWKMMTQMQKRFPKWHVLQNIIVGTLVSSLFLSPIVLAVNLITRFTELSFQNTLGYLFPAWLLNFILLLFIQIYLYTKQQAENELKLSRMEKEKAVYQFEALKNQLNPHFLFNSLNVLSSLAYQDPEKTNRFAKKLSQVYRYLLTTQNLLTVTVEEELRFVDSYLYLEKIRFGEGLKIKIDKDEHCMQRSIVPASIQLLIENALKHNVNNEQHPLSIEVSITDEGVTVRNNVQPLTGVARNGMGLKNLQQQYAFHGLDINIHSSEKEYVVSFPYIRDSY